MTNAGKCVMVTAALLVVAAVYFAIDPAAAEWMPKCPIHMLTGFDCPGCGSQRMMHSLLRGDLAGAWRHNSYLLMMLPVLAVMIYFEVTRKRHPKTYLAIHSMPVVMTLCGSIVCWTIVRNLI